MKHYTAICPLVNFKLQYGFFPNEYRTTEELNAIFKERQKQLIEGIELIEGIKIRFFTKQDFTNFDKCLSISLSNFRQLFSTRSFLLEKVVGSEDERNNISANVMRKTVLALQLFKEGHVFGDDVFYFDFDNGSFAGWTREDAPLNFDLLGRIYALNFEELPKLKMLLSQIHRIDFEKRKNLDLACKRFQRAYQEYSYDDRLIDYMIAFEALFLKRGKRTRSKKFEIAKGCSSLLGNNEEEKEDIRKTLITAYDMRNDIIHEGEYLAGEDTNPFSIIEKIEGYLREAIVNSLIDSHDK